METNEFPQRRSCYSFVEVTSSTWTSIILSCHPLLKTCFMLFPPAIINYTYFWCTAERVAAWSCLFFVQTGWSPTSSLLLHLIYTRCLNCKSLFVVWEEDLSRASNNQTRSFSFIRALLMISCHNNVLFGSFITDGKLRPLWSSLDQPNVANLGENIVSFWCNVVSFRSNMHCYLVLLKY